MADRKGYSWAIRIEDHPEDWEALPRAEWGEGPWLTEPDLIEWRAEGCRYPMIIWRGGMGQLCGYVGVPPEHPFYRRTAGFPGVSYAGPCDEFRAPTGEPPTCWWFGFSCNGYMPYHESFFRLISDIPGVPALTPRNEPSSYTDVPACQQAVESLAAYLAHWEETLRGVTARDNGDGTVAMISADGTQLLSMPDDVWEGFTRLGQERGAHDRRSS